jgi:2-dehydro-3-deoxy-D-gluconate 5-dehydrogenase
MDFQLDGHSAVVTGATRGLGRAIAEALANEGVHVLGVGRDVSMLADLEEHESGRIASVRCDVADHDAVTRLPRLAVERFGRLDIIVNNAGLLLKGAFQDQPQAVWEDLLAINLLSAIVLTRAAAPVLLGQGAGKVINIASTNGIRGAADVAAYCTTKGALLMFTKALAIEWAPRGVQVNAIGPGAYDSDMQPDHLRKPGPALDERLARIPDGRMGQPHEVGPIACFLASPLSSHVTGALFMTDGGESARL